MTHLDMRTLFLSGAVVALLMGAIVLAFGARAAPQRTLRYWGWSLIALTVGFTLLALQGALHAPSALVCGNLLIVTAGVLLLETARRTRGRTRPTRLWLVVPAVGLVSLACTLVWDSFRVRSAV